MKTIVCYGDSNTHGFNPADRGRYDYAVRWPGRLQLLLGREDYYVVEEGLNSRTTVHSDACYDDDKSGAALLPAVLKTHMPVDLLVLMLGSNDLKLRFHMQPADIARGAALLVQTAQQVSVAKRADGRPCEILLVSPPHITENLRGGGCYDEFGDRAIALSRALAERYAAVAHAAGVHVFDAARVAAPSPLDGLHLPPEGHAALAQALAPVCRAILARG